MKTLLAGIFILLFLGASLSVQSQEITRSDIAQIVSDNEYEYGVGDAILLTQVVELKEGREIYYLLPNGTPVLLEGPIKGILGELLKSDTLGKRWKVILSDILSKKGNESHVLMVRGNSGPMQWNPDAVPIPFKGKFCLGPDSELSFFRPGTSPIETEFTVTSLNKSKFISVPSGKNVYVTWPQGLETTGSFKIAHPAWFDEYSFVVVRVESMNIENLVAARCSYHLEKLKHLIP